MTKKIPVGWYLKQIINPPTQPKKRKSKKFNIFGTHSVYDNKAKFDEWVHPRNLEMEV
jgi:hypothetical protein